jgi:hypothetical protein
MPAIVTTVNNYYTNGASSLNAFNLFAAAFAAITATNPNITLYQSIPASYLLVYAISNPIGSGSYNTVYLSIDFSRMTAYGQCAASIHETWNTGTSTGTNSIVIFSASAAWPTGTSLSYATYTDNASYGIVTVYNSALSSVFTLGYLATATNNAFQSENTMASVQAIINNGVITPTNRNSQAGGGSSNAQYTYSLGSAALPTYNTTPVIAYPLSLQGLGLTSNDIGFRSASAAFNDTYTIGSQVWRYISPTAATQGFYVRIT